jgi:hypothetical protein
VPEVGILVCGVLPGSCLCVELGTYFAGCYVCTLSFGVVGSVSMFNGGLGGGRWVRDFVGVIAIPGLGDLVGDFGLVLLLKKRPAFIPPPLHVW